jgi:hypothetical protein
MRIQSHVATLNPEHPGYVVPLAVCVNEFETAFLRIY